MPEQPLVDSHGGGQRARHCRDQARLADASPHQPALYCHGRGSVSGLSHQRGPYSVPGAAARPGLLLLDLHMPKIDGTSVLNHMREDDRLHCLPVVIFTTSRLAGRTVCPAYELGAHAYLYQQADRLP